MNRNSDYRVTLTDPVSGRGLTVAPEERCRLSEGGFTGFGCTGFDVTVRSYASRNGGYAQKRRFAERQLALTFEIDGNCADEVRRDVEALMDPAHDLELDVLAFGVHRRITVIPAEEADWYRQGVRGPAEVTLRFVAPAVFFRDAEEKTVVFRDACPMLTFPMNFMAGAGTVSGLYRTTDEAGVDNPGDGECGLVAVIRASGGSVVNPGVSMGGKSVRCPLTLADGDELVIDTRPGQKNILKNGVRCFAFTPDSVFFSLPAGTSVVSVTCDSGGEYVDAEISFTPLYYGM